MTDGPGPSSFPATIPLFPLPNVVLFPRAVLPLHIFEDRYKRMTADVLQSHRQVAMALLKGGWEKDYYGRPAIEPVVCVGSILSHERLPDGCYNFLLQGHTRAVIRREVGAFPYRLAELEPMREIPCLEIDLDGARKILAELFAREAFATLPGGKQIRQMLSGPFPTAAVADVLAFHVLSDSDPAFRQSLLAEPSIKERVWRVVRAVQAMRPAWQNRPDNASFN